MISDRDQQIRTLNEKIARIQLAAARRDEKLVRESHAQVAEMAQTLELATAQATLREQQLASEWRASMLKMQEDISIAIRPFNSLLRQQ